MKFKLKTKHLHWLHLNFFCGAKKFRTEGGGIFDSVNYFTSHSLWDKSRRLLNCGKLTVSWMKKFKPQLSSWTKLCLSLHYISEMWRIHRGNELWSDIITWYWIWNSGELSCSSQHPCHQQRTQQFLQTQSRIISFIIHKNYSN